MSSCAVAIATAATQDEQDDLTLTISPVVFHMYKYNSDQSEIIKHLSAGNAVPQLRNRHSQTALCISAITL